MVDTRLPFGSRSAPGIFHRLTQSVRRMMERRGFNAIVYLYDFLVIADLQTECLKAYNTLCSLLCDLGFSLSSNKLVPPCQKLTFLGIEIDTCQLTLALPSDKLNSLKQLICIFKTRKRANKRQLQQLAGRLNWACKVVFGGRTFLRRILDRMNTMPTSSSQCRLTLDFKRDIEWWDEFLESFNGKDDFLDTRPVTDLQTDACTSGLGAVFQGDWFYLHFLPEMPSLFLMHINFKEALCIVFAAIRWAPQWRNKKVLVYCDNTAAVAMLNKGTTRNPFMMFWLRHLFWYFAHFNFQLEVRHSRPTKHNC